MAARIRLDLCNSLCGVYGHRDTPRDQVALPDVRSHASAAAFRSAHNARDFIFHCMAGGISLSGIAAELFDANFQESMGGTAGSFGHFWAFAHRACALSEL